MPADRRPGTRVEYDSAHSLNQEGAEADGELPRYMHVQTFDAETSTEWHLALACQNMLSHELESIDIGTHALESSFKTASSVGHKMKELDRTSPKAFTFQRDRCLAEFLCRLPEFGIRHEELISISNHCLLAKSVHASASFLCEKSSAHMELFGSIRSRALSVEFGAISLRKGVISMHPSDWVPGRTCGIKSRCRCALNCFDSITRSLPGHEYSQISP